MMDEIFSEAAELARVAFSPETVSQCVLVWDSVYEEGKGGPRDLAYFLEGWDRDLGAWVANDTTNPGETFREGDIADAQEVKFFTYFLLGSRGAIRPGETIQNDADRFDRFEAAGGELGKWAWTGKRPKGDPA